MIVKSLLNKNPTRNVFGTSQGRFAQTDKDLKKLREGVPGPGTYLSPDHGKETSKDREAASFNYRFNKDVY